MNECICDLQQALAYLRNRRILALDAPTRTLILMIENRIQVITQSSRFSLSIEEFLDLYQDNRFWLLEEGTNDIEVALERDAEYYSWKHK